MDDLLKKFVDQSFDAIMITDAVGKVRVWNQQQERISGVSAAKAIGTNIWDIEATTQIEFLSDNEHSKPTKELLRLFFEEGDDTILSHPSEWLVRLDDDTEVYLHEVFQQMAWEGKRSLSSVTRDITKGKLSELSLRESTERLLDAQRFAGLGYWVWDVKTGDVKWTEEIYKIFKLDPETFTPQIDSIMALSPWPEENQRDQELIDRAIKNKERGQFEQRFLYPDGSSGYYYSTFRGRYDTDGNLTTLEGTVMDITERKRQEKELEEHRTRLEEKIVERTKELSQTNRQLVNVNRELEKKNKVINEQKVELEKALKELKNAQAKLIQSEKMASLGVLTAGVAHEINNPLNFISGGTMGLEAHLEENGVDIEKDDDLKMLLDSIKEGVHRASEIVKGLNHFSRDKESFEEDCDLHQIIDHCLVMIKSKFPDGLSIEKNYREEGANVKGNAGKLHQVFLNVLYNAIQAMDEKADNGQPALKIQTLMANDRIEINFTDNGVGISDENLSKISDPFFTTKNPGEGTGLGLSISYLIIEQHNGNIAFSSFEGKGTTVSILLPIKGK